jgi:hypothetical protein
VFWPLPCLFSTTFDDAAGPVRAIWSNAAQDSARQVEAQGTEPR